MMKQLVQVVAGLSPPATGVGDYALGLAHELRGSHAVDSVFLVCDPTWHIGATGLPFPVKVISNRRPSCLSADLEAAFKQHFRDVSGGRQCLVLLHLSAYGFERNGCPLWLARGLRWWKRANPDSRLITIFHELNADGPPWTKAFWLSRLQKAVIRHIANSSDQAFTSTLVFQRRLTSWTADRGLSICCLPIPSNVGEPANLKQLAARRSRAVMFGIRPGARGLSEVARARLAQLIRAWGVSELCVIGGSPLPGAFEGLGCPVQIMGHVSPEAVSSLLADSTLGLLSYPAWVLSKSGVYGAYCAHRLPSLLLPVPGDTRQPSEDGLLLGQHYIELESADPGWKGADFQRLADQARSWYMPHRLSAHADHVASLMAEVRRTGLRPCP